MMRVAILGVGSIGKFHAREFRDAGAEVVAILEGSEEDAKQRADMLKEEFGIEAKAYWDLDSLLTEEELDAVSICTPWKLHSEQVEKCLEKGLHVLCEKPFVFDSKDGNFETAERLVKLAEEKNLKLAVNTQWLSVVPLIKSTEELEEFSMYMEPPERYFSDMMVDVIPHMNSLLIALGGDGKIENIRFGEIDQGLKILFDYVYDGKTCKAEYVFAAKDTRPRRFEFSVNGKKYVREVDEDYKQDLVCGEERIAIEDPLKVSVERFVEAVNGEGKVLTSWDEILKNIELQDFIVGSYKN